MTGPAVVEAGLGQFVPVWFVAVAAAVAAGIVIGSAVAAGWLVAARQHGQRERHGQRLTAERRPPGAEPEPVVGAAAAGLGAERQARGQQEKVEEERGDREIRTAMANEMKL